MALFLGILSLLAGVGITIAGFVASPYILWLIIVGIVLALIGLIIIAINGGAEFVGELIEGILDGLT